MAQASSALVLVVGDEEFMRQALVDVVIIEGFRVLAIDDGTAALTLLRDGLRPSLILVDLAMQSMDGPAFRKEQSKDPALRGIATVVLTDSRAWSAAPGGETGAMRTLAKPVDYDDLVALLSRHCAKAA